MNRHSIRYAYLPQTQHLSLKNRLHMSHTKEDIVSFLRIFLDDSTGSYQFRVHNLHQYSRGEKHSIQYALLPQSQHLLLKNRVHMSHTKDDILSIFAYIS